MNWGLMMPHVLKANTGVKTNNHGNTNNHVKTEVKNNTVKTTEVKTPCKTECKPNACHTECKNKKEEKCATDKCLTVCDKDCTKQSTCVKPCLFTRIKNAIKAIWEKIKGLFKSSKKETTVELKKEEEITAIPVVSTTKVEHKK